MSAVDGALGEWETAEPPIDTGGADGPAGSVDLGAGVRDAVDAAVARRLQAIAGDALEEVLDDSKVEQLRAAALTAAGRALGPPTLGEPELPTLYFATLPEFVAQLLVPMYQRSLSANTATWCAEWWRHTEAIVRLEALWRSWEHLRLDPATGMSVWLRDHLDHHMPILLSADGPFKGCTPSDHGVRLKPFALIEPPPRLFSAT